MSEEVVSRVKPAAARAALRDVAEGGGLDERARASVAVLRAVLDELAAVRAPHEKADADCPCCGCPYLNVAYVNEHLSACAVHPFIVKARALREAMKLAPEIATELGLKAVPIDGAVVNDVEAALVPRPPGRRGRYVPAGDRLRDHVDFLAGPRRKQYPTVVETYAKELNAAVELWERLLHRETDRCRLCGETVPLSEVMRHALGCVRHPAAIAASAAEAWLREQLGQEGQKALVGLLLERERLINGLTALVDACKSFDSDMGWNGEEYSSRSHEEATLGRAVSAAAKLVGLGPRQYRPSFEPTAEASSGPEFARPVWKALLRVRENGPTPGSHGGTDEDARLLRKAVTEAVELQLAFPENFVCPACKRPGLWVHQAAPHVPVCPGHDATVRERETEARLFIALAVLREKRGGQLPQEVKMKELPPIPRFWPSAWSDDDAGRTNAKRSNIEGVFQKLEFLLVPEKRLQYPTIVKGYADDVASTLSAWQRHRTALESVCPYCKTEKRFLELFAHMAECTAHPAMVRADANEATLVGLGAAALRPPGRLRREADLACLAIARLAEFAESFTGSFGDDDRGRGIIYSALLPKWKGEMNAAIQTLEALRSPTSTTTADGKP